MARTHVLDNDLYMQVTDRIAAALEAGVCPWVCPWRRDGEGGRHRNGCSGHVYKGINIVLTGMSGFASNRWYTFRQAQALNGHVKKGQKGTTVIYWSFVNAKRPEGADAEEVGHAKIPVLRSYTIFNAEQVEWPVGSKHVVVEPVVSDGTAEANFGHVEQVIAGSGAEVACRGTRAFYSPKEDAIVVPVMARFQDPSAYYATVLHELAHWTGHKSRLGRDLKGRFGSESYAAEELVAEFAAAFLSADLGISGHLQHAEYLGAWIKVLRSDKRAIFTAARHAQEAADYILKKADPVEAVADLQEAA